MLEEDTVWKCVFNLVYVHDNSKGKDRGLKNQGYMITQNKNPSYRPEFSANSSQDQLSAGLPLGGRTPYITSKNRLCTPKLHIKDVPQTSENSFGQPQVDIETSCLQKKPAHIYQIKSWILGFFVETTVVSRR